MKEIFSNCLKEVLTLSKEEAFRLGHDSIGIEHLILGMISRGEGVAVRLLIKLGVQLEQLGNELEKVSKKAAASKIKNTAGILLSHASEKTLKIAYREARVCKTQLVDTEHLLLSILWDKDNLATQILIKYDVTYNLVKEELKTLARLTK